MNQESVGWLPKHFNFITQWNFELSIEYIDVFFLSKQEIVMGYHVITLYIHRSFDMWIESGQQVIKVYDRYHTSSWQHVTILVLFKILFSRMELLKRLNVHLHTILWQRKLNVAKKIWVCHTHVHLKNHNQKYGFMPITIVHQHNRDPTPYPCAPNTYLQDKHLDQVYNVAQDHRCNWMQLLCNFLDLLEQFNGHLNLAYQLLQAQHPLKSASKWYFSLFLPTSLSLTRTS